jgi:hypothetical protein
MARAREAAAPLVRRLPSHLREEICNDTVNEACRRMLNGLDCGKWDGLRWGTAHRTIVLHAFLAVRPKPPGSGSGPNCGPGARIDVGIVEPGTGTAASDESVGDGDQPDDGRGPGQPATPWVRELEEDEIADPSTAAQPGSERRLIVTIHTPTGNVRADPERLVEAVKAEVQSAPDFADCYAVMRTVHKGMGCPDTMPSASPERARDLVLRARLAGSEDPARHAAVYLLGRRRIPPEVLETDRAWVAIHREWKNAENRMRRKAPSLLRRAGLA